MLLNGIQNSISFGKILVKEESLKENVTVPAGYMFPDVLRSVMNDVGMDVYGVPGGYVISGSEKDEKFVKEMLEERKIKFEEIA